MIDAMVNTILSQVKEKYPGVRIPGAMRAVITEAEMLEKTYETGCKIFCEDNGKEYRCRIERNYFKYSVKVTDNNGRIVEQYPELIQIESRQEYEIGDAVQVVFLGNELEAAIIGG